MKPRDIKSGTKCVYCGHSFEDAEQGPYRIYSEARAKWLEEAAHFMEESTGDDAWVDWMDEGLRLTKSNE